MINSKDISVIVQGKINSVETPQCLNSIRKYLPEAEIILSTWEEDDVSGLDYDVLVKSPDPGTAVMPIKRKLFYNNLNRQLLSTQEGLKKANRKYALKLRSDLILTGDKFLEYFDKFPARTNNYNLFRHKVLADVFYTRFCIRCKKLKNNIPVPFHVSDWWLFGLREDLITYFADTSLVKEPGFTDYFTLAENKNKISPYGGATFKFPPEQYFCYSCFARNYNDIHMNDAADISESLTEKSRECIINNFIILGYEQSGIYLNKYIFSKNKNPHHYIGLYNFYKYESEYKKYCDNNYQISAAKPIFEDDKPGYSYLRVQKHCSKLLAPSTPLTGKLEQIFIGIPLALAAYGIDLIKEKFRRKG